MESGCDKTVLEADWEASDKNKADPEADHEAPRPVGPEANNSSIGGTLQDTDEGVRWKPSAGLDGGWCQRGLEDGVGVAWLMAGADVVEAW